MHQVKVHCFSISLLISQGNLNPFANERKKMTKARIGDADFQRQLLKKQFYAKKKWQSTGNSKLFVSYQRLCVWHKISSSWSVFTWLACKYVSAVYQVVLHYDDQQNASFGHYLYRSLENFAKGQYRKCRAQENTGRLSGEPEWSAANRQSRVNGRTNLLSFDFWKFLDYDLSNFEREVLVASLFMDMPALCKNSAAISVRSNPLYHGVERNWFWLCRLKWVALYRSMIG